MGSIDKYIFRTTPASLALNPGSLAGSLRIARGLERTLGGIDPMTGQNWMIPTLPGFDSRMVPALAIGESNARLARLLGRPVTA
jgi:lipopolysaccharide export system permease protein